VKERLTLRRNSPQKHFTLSPWKDVRKETFRRFVKYRFKAIDYVKDNQLYRPLSDTERQRFLTQQACMKDMPNYGHHKSQCEYNWYIDEDSYNAMLADKWIHTIESRIPLYAAELQPLH